MVDPADFEIERLPCDDGHRICFREGMRGGPSVADISTKPVLMR
jgi:hypothetical protein